MKGVELGTTMRMSEVIAEAGGIEQDRIVVVSGPNLATEIARKQPAAGVVACRDMATAERVAAACATPYFRPYTDTDVIGAEVCGATKNVVALAVGHGRGDGLRRQHEGHDHHPRPGRDDAPGPGARARDPQTFMGSPASATSSPRACRRCRATTPSASGSAAA